eukprot:2100074-Lingulodinium_polyedra.AAC.1
MDVGPAPDHGRGTRSPGSRTGGGSCSARADDTAGDGAGDAVRAQRLRGQQGADHRATIVPPCPA